jgi:hypothetical protein
MGRWLRLRIRDSDGRLLVDGSGKIEKKLVEGRGKRDRSAGAGEVKAKVSIRKLKLMEVNAFQSTLFLVCTSQISQVR